jgi:hypothetical protein
MLNLAKTAANIALLNAVLVAFIFASSGCSQPALGLAGDARQPIEISATGSDGDALRDGILELATFAAGGRTEQSIWIRNGSRVAQRIGGYTSTCECLSIVGLPVDVVAGESAAARLCLDLQAEPSSRGNFEVVVMLNVKEGEAVPLKVRYQVEAGGETSSETGSEAEAKLEPIAADPGARP